MLFIGASGMFETWVFTCSVAAFGTLGALLCIAECTLIPKRTSDGFERARLSRFRRNQRLRSSQNQLRS